MVKAKTKAAPQQLKGWFGSQTATRLGVFASIPRSPPEGPHQLVVPFSTGEDHRYSKAGLVEGRDLLESTSLPRRALQRAQSIEGLLQNPFHKWTLLKTPQHSQATPNNLHRGSSRSVLPALRSSWKIASGPGKIVSLEQEELQQLSQGSPVLTPSNTALHTGPAFCWGSCHGRWWFHLQLHVTISPAESH